MQGIKAMVYIRPDNIDKWQAIDNKSEYINDLLSGDEASLERKVRIIVKQELQAIQGQY